MESKDPHIAYQGIRFAPGSNAFVFIICSFLALIFWFLKSMDERYVTQVSLPIKYENFPENQILKDSLPGSIKFEVDAKGWDLLALKTGTNSYPVAIDLSSASGKRNINLSPNSPYIENLLPENLQVLNIKPDNLSIEFDHKMSKTVPVKLNTRIFYADQHALADSITVMPREITLKGPESYVKPIDTVETVSLTFDSLTKSINQDIPLALPQKPFLDANKSAVNVQISVGKLTERSLTIPIEILNPLFKGELSLIPSKAKVIFQTTLNQYQAIGKKDFRVTVDASMINTSKPPDKLPLRLVNQPDFAYNIRLRPEEVNYIIENQDEQ